MTTDLYAKCPCGSGKKIKFCCRDIITDIERIERMMQGDQRSAALDKVEKLLQKHPNRPALLSLKAMICLELQQFDETQSVLDQLLNVEPRNSSGLAMKAALSVADGDLTEGLKLLHQALRYSDSAVSQMVYQSYLSVCVHLVQRGEYISAYAHLLTLVSITQGKDRDSVSMLMKITSSPKLPVVFQGLIIRDDAPDNVTWKREFEVALDLYRHGDWTGAAEMLDHMNARILDEPTLLRSQAILQAWICQNEKAIKTLRYYAAIPNVDVHDAAEAEACAQVLEPASSDDLVPIHQLTHELEDAKSVMEKFLSYDKAVSLPVHPDPDSDSPPPLGRFVIFDRPLNSGNDDSNEVRLEDCAHQLCTVVIFGKETDRNARVVITIAMDDAFTSSLATVNEICDLSIPEDAQAVVVDEDHKVERLLRPLFRPTSKISLEQFGQLQREWLAAQLATVWPNTPLAQLDGKTAKQAAGDKRLQCRVLAAILNLEMWADRQSFDFGFDQLRSELGLPSMPSIDPVDVDLRALSPAKLHRLEIDKLCDEDLAYVFEVSSVRPNGLFLYRLGEEILKRPDIPKHIDLIEVHERMAELCQSTDEQLGHLQKARDLAIDEGASPASWVVAELDVRIQRGESEIAKQLVTEIQSRYINEPGIAQMFMSVLSKYGLMPAAQAANSASAMATHAVESVATEAATPVSAASSVWTPDAGGEPGENSEDGEKSQLWVPGMD